MSISSLGSLGSTYSHVGAGEENSEMVQEVFDFTKEMKMKDRKRRIFGAQVVPYKGDILQNQLIQSLEYKMSISKQQAMDQLILVKKYERSIQQSKDIENNLKSRLSNAKSNQRNQNFIENSKDIRSMEQMSDLPLGYGAILVNVINSYDDTEFVHELSQIPEEVKRSLAIDMFVQIAFVATGNQLSYCDALNLYNICQSRNRTKKPQDDFISWDHLALLLRKQVQLIHLVKSLPSQNNILQSSSKFSSNNSVVSNRSASSKKTSVVSLESMPLNQVNASLLQKELKKSHHHQQQLTDQIISNLSVITHMSIPVKNKSDYKQATQFAQHMAVRKIEQIVLKVSHRAIETAYSRWQNYIKFLKLEKSIKKFTKVLGTTRLFNGVTKILQNKLGRVFMKIRYVIAWSDSVECEAACIEIQKIWRGSLKRLQNWKYNRNNCATIIQALIRGRLGKKIFADRLYQARLKRAVRKIEHAWDHLKWLRVHKRLLKLKKQTNCTLRIQTIYRGYRARKKYKIMYKKILMAKGSVKMQSLWRKYRAICRVEKIIRQRKRVKSATRIQNCWRCKIARKVVGKRRHIFISARKIQLCCLIYKAKKRVALQVIIVYNEKRRKAAIRIQSLCRGRISRKRVKYLWQKRYELRKLQVEALHLMARTIKGYHAWNILLRRCKYRDSAATIIQIFCMSTVQRIKAKRKVELIRRNKQREISEQNATKIINLTSTLGTTKIVAHKMVDKFRTKKKEKINLLPKYYQLRLEYFESQNKLHGKAVIKIQCLYRVRKAKKMFKLKLNEHKIRKIQKKWRDYCVIQDAKLRVQIVREKRQQLILAVIQIQRIIRGFVPRRVYRRHRSAKLVTWFIHEIRALGLIGKALSNFRVRKAHLDKINRSVSKIQALIRGVLKRIWFRKVYKKLVKDRDTRIKNKRLKAVILIQSAIRRKLAHKIVAKRRLFLLEEYKKQLMLEALDGRLDDMHGDWMNELLAIRIETAGRGLLAKKTVDKQKIIVQQNQAEKSKENLMKSAAKIQALMRGVLGRKKHKKRLPALRKERQLRSLCVDCESRAATLKCIQCKDRFCKTCYDNLHRTGYRKTHSWDVFIPPSSKYSLEAAKVVEEKQAVVNDPKNDWEEFFDKQAKAKYWFNKKTQEAVWVKPY